MKKCMLMLLLLGIMTAGTAQGETPIIVIANPSVKADSITKKELSEVFTGASSSLKGSHVVPVLLKEGPTHVEFLSYMGKSAVAVLLIWRGLVMSGQASMPKAFESESAEAEYVARTAGAIGYVRKDTPHEGVKVLVLQ